MTVTIPYDPAWKALDWAKQNCPGYLTNDIHMRGYNDYDITKVDFFFSNEKDALAFTLRWL